MQKIITFLLAVTLSVAVYSQELNCTFTVNAPSITDVNKQVFTTLQNAVTDFLNNQRWTELVYADNEKISCNFVLLVTSVEADVFTCELQVQASRPVFGTSYTTGLLNTRDKKVIFTYKEFDPIELNTSSYDNNLTAVLAYYAYLIIGLDLDSFSRFGGTAAFTAAEQIVNSCQSRSNDAETAGWKMAFADNSTRYSLINDIMNDSFKGLRDFYYEYHRLALDNMAKNVDNARAKIAEKIPVLRELNRKYPGAAFINAFLNAKNDELINIFAKFGTSEEKRSVHEILVAVNPTLVERYNLILE
ncbi:MAG: DUF4835 family protein [Bacteroidales bacterium]|nr:DUF4835 family protein [Bacteroidales bacterium]